MEIWETFFSTEQDNKIMDSSEVWRNYAQAELSRESALEKKAFENKLDEENRIMSEVEQFRQRVASDPVLRAKLKKVADVIDANPEFMDKVDPDFLNGLSLISFEE
jgi:hypothetical protein